MEKVELIDQNNYFVESRKALQIAVEKENSLYAGMSREEKLALLKERKKVTVSVEEYEKLEELVKQLERDIQFNDSIPLVPDEYKETIKMNLQVESDEFNKRRKELRTELKKQLPYLQDVLLPLLVNIHELNSLSVIPGKINAMLEYHHYFGKNGLRAEPRIKYYGNNHKSETVEKIQKVISAIKAMSI